VAEVSTAAKAVRVALPPGEYRVERLSPAPRLAGLLEVAADRSAVVEDARLSPVTLAVAAHKGGAVEPRQRVFAFAEAWLASAIMRNFGPSYGASGGGRFDLGRASLYLQASYSAKDVDDEGFTYRYRATALTSGAARRFEVGALALSLGGQLGIAWAHQSLGDGASAGSAVPQAGPTVGLLVPLISRLGLRVTWAGLLHTFRLRDAADPRGHRVFRGSVQVATALDVGLW